MKTDTEEIINNFSEEECRETGYATVSPQPIMFST